MKHLALVAGVASMMAIVGAQAQALSPAEVATAVELGLDGKTLQKKCSASGENGFDIIVEGPVGRVMRAARDAKRADRVFTSADVTMGLDGPFLTVTTKRDFSKTTAASAVQMPGNPGVWVLPEAAEAERRQDRMTLGARYRTEVTLRFKPTGAKEPTVITPIGPLVNNAATDSRLLRPSPGSDITATFDLAAFRALRPGDVEVVVFMSDAGERKCKISDKDRAAIR